MSPTCARSSCTGRAGPRIFIGKPTKDTSEADVKEYFSRFGYVMDVYLPKTKDNKSEHRGFGFVTFETEAAINRVMAAGSHRLRWVFLVIRVPLVHLAPLYRLAATARPEPKAVLPGRCAAGPLCHCKFPCLTACLQLLHQAFPVGVSLLWSGACRGATIAIDMAMPKEEDDMVNPAGSGSLNDGFNFGSVGFPGLGMLGGNGMDAAGVASCLGAGFDTSVMGGRGFGIMG